MRLRARGNMSDLFNRYLAFGLPLWVTEIGTIDSAHAADYLQNVYQLARDQYAGRVRVMLLVLLRATAWCLRSDSSMAMARRSRSTSAFRSWLPFRRKNNNGNSPAVAAFLSNVGVATTSARNDG